jgi:uncharacterized membrane protein HdeD (DUF308 family)
MRTSTSAALWIVRVTGLAQIVLGVLFWTRNALSLVPVHMLIGTVLVLGLWFLAFQAIQSGANPGLGLLSILWGLLTVALGMTQARILPGQMHWIIQVAHLLVGMGAMGMADNLARSVTRGAVAAR